MFTGSLASHTSQQIFICESLFELFSACISKEGASPPLFLVRIRKIGMVALGNIEYEHMTSANKLTGYGIYGTMKLV